MSKAQADPGAESSELGAIRSVRGAALGLKGVSGKLRLQVADASAGVQASAEAAIQQVDKDIKSIQDTTQKRWSTLKAKINDDMQSMKQRIAEHKHDRDVQHAEKHAQRLEEEASFAIDYANASVEQAQLAVLDAIIGRLDADEARMR